MPCEYCPKVRVSVGSSPNWRRASSGERIRPFAVKAGEISKVLSPSEFVVKHRSVAHVTDAIPNLVRFIVPVEMEGAVSGTQKPCENAQ